MDTCISVGSFANTEEKQNILRECIKSLKQLNLPILIVSHTPLPYDIQEMVEYYFYDKNNLLIKDSEIFNTLSLDDLDGINRMGSEYVYGGLRFASGLYKKNYFASCLVNSYNEYNILDMLGFKYVIHWEYDYILGEKSSENILNLLNEIKISGRKASFFSFKIHNFTSISPNPSIFEVKYVLDKFISNKYVGDIKSYLEFSKNMFAESWKYYILSGDNHIHINRHILELDSYIPDTKKDLFKVEKNDFSIYYNNISGFYFKEKDGTITNNLVYSNINPSNTIMFFNVKIYFNEDLILNHNLKLNSLNWHMFNIDEKYVNQILNGNNQLKLIEEIIYDDKTEHFEYILKKENIDMYKQFKRYKEI